MMHHAADAGCLRPGVRVYVFPDALLNEREIVRVQSAIWMCSCCSVAAWTMDDRGGHGSLWSHRDQYGGTLPDKTKLLVP